MTFQVLNKKMEYRGCPVVVRRFGQNFEYITCVNGEIYSSYVTARKGLIRSLFLMPYSVEEINRISNYMIAMAQTTIDTVLGAAIPKRNGNN